MISPLSCKGSFSGDQKRDISKVKIPDCLVRFPYFWCDGEVNIGFQICNKLNVFDRCFRVARVCCKVLSYVESRSKKTAPSIFTTRIDGFTVYLVYWFIVETLTFQKYWTVGTTSTVRNKKKQQLASLFPLSSPNIRASLQRAKFSRTLRREFLSARQGLEVQETWEHLWGEVKMNAPTEDQIHLIYVTMSSPQWI